MLGKEREGIEFSEYNKILIDEQKSEELQHWMARAHKQVNDRLHFCFFLFFILSMRASLLAVVSGNNRKTWKFELRNCSVGRYSRCAIGPNLLLLLFLFLIYQVCLLLESGFCNCLWSNKSSVRILRGDLWSSCGFCPGIEGNQSGARVLIYHSKWASLVLYLTAYG